MRYYQYKHDRARRTLKGIDEQVRKAEQAVAGKTAVKRNRFVKLTGAAKAVNHELDRPIPIDGLPVLGPSATVKNFHFAVTHSGVTLCLRVAELVGAEVRGELVDELTPFRHSRLNARQPPAVSADYETREEP